MYAKDSPFDRCGFSSLDDLETALWAQQFTALEAHQRAFIAQEAKFRSPTYIWPSDPLHKWSRVWEYPYVLYHLNRFFGSRSSAEEKVVIDLGSGVTFFPFALAADHFVVYAVDTDPVGAHDIPLACDALGIARNQVEFRLADAKALPFDDQSIDAVYSVSVLEHIPEPHAVIQEIARVLKPTGLFVLTIDVSMDGIHEITAENFLKLQQAIDQYFAPEFAETAIHPMRLLKTTNGPYPYRFPKKNLLYRVARTIKRYFKGLPLSHPRLLACYGYVGRPR